MITFGEFKKSLSLKNDFELNETLRQLNEKISKLQKVSSEDWAKRQLKGLKKAKKLVEQEMGQRREKDRGISIDR